jgi:very-short-patch-repair endonuclease
MNIPNFSILKGPQFSEKHFKKHYPEFLEYINHTFSSDLSFQEKLYWYAYDLKEAPKCYCGGNVVFEGFGKGYRKYCSRKCMNADPAKKSAVEQTNLKKYGGKAPSSSDAVRQKMKSTCRERYGADNIMQSEYKQRAFNTIKERYGGVGNASDDIKAKQLSTRIERYGSTSFNNRAKYKSTCRERYGTENPLSLDEIKQRISEGISRYIVNKYDDIIEARGTEYICSCPHPDCTKCTEKQYTINSERYFGRKREHVEPCTILHPLIPRLTKGSTIEIFIQNILDKCNIKYETNVRGLIGRQEIDIYCPELKIGIECDGIYWHSDIHKSSTYHSNKTTTAEQAGIKLYHVWEDQVITKPEIVESMVRNWIGCTERSVYARKCEVREVDKTVCQQFLNTNHIQGATGCKIAYGLYYNDELLSMMTFGHRNISMKGEDGWELVRFCSLLGVRVVGGASKLLKYFISKHLPDVIYSYASRDISSGGLYKKLGFVGVGKGTDSYWYIDTVNMQRYHRMSFTKDRIVQLGWKDSKDGWTEKRVMDEHGFIRIYDAGQTKWVLNCDT